MNVILWFLSLMSGLWASLWPMRFAGPEGEDLCGNIEWPARYFGLKFYVLLQCCRGSTNETGRAGFKVLLGFARDLCFGCLLIGTLSGTLLRAFILGHFQVESYRYRSLIEGLYTL